MKMLFILGLCLIHSATKAETLSIPGSGSPEVILKKLAEAYTRANPNDKVEIPPSTRSTGGIRAIQAGDVVLARVSRLPTPEEGKNIEYLPFAMDAVVFAVGRDVKIKNISDQQIADIFSGKIKKWSEIGGPKAPIRVIIRNETESTHKLIDEKFKSFRGIRFTNEAKLAYHTYEVVDLVKKYNFSIGFLSQSSVIGPENSVNILALNNQAPTKENIKSGQYPLTMTFGLIFKKEKITPIAQRFIDYIFSETGEKVMEQQGLIPIKRITQYK